MRQVNIKLQFITGEKIMTTAAGIGSRVDHPHFGRGVIVDLASESFIIWFKSQQGTRSIGKDFEGLTIIEKTEADKSGAGITVADIEVALERVLAQRLHEVEMVPIANKWLNGTLVMQPADKTLQGKEIPLDPPWNRHRAAHYRRHHRDQGFSVQGHERCRS